MAEPNEQGSMEQLSKSIQLSTKLAWFINQQTHELRELRKELIEYREFLDEELIKQRENG